MADFTELSNKLKSFGLTATSPSGRTPANLDPGPIIIEERLLKSRTLSNSSNSTDFTTPSNSGKSTPVNRKLPQTRSMEEVFWMESPSHSIDSQSPMGKRCTPPTSPYVSQRDMHPLTRKFTGELGIASDVTKLIEKADFSDDDSAEDDEEDDVIVLTDGEDNNNNTSDNGDEQNKSNKNCNNVVDASVVDESYESIKKVSSDDIEPEEELFEFLARSIEEVI